MDKADRNRRCWLGVALSAVLVLGLAGCGGERVPLAFAPAPFQNGERAELDALHDGRLPKGTMAFEVRRSGSEWRLITDAQRADLTFRSEVTATDQLVPLRSVMTQQKQSYEAHYEAGRVRYAGSEGEESVPRAVDGIDNFSLYHQLRALPFADGYQRSFTIYNPRARADERFTVQVAGSEPVTVPAGTFDCWQVVLSFESGRIDTWLAKAPPHWLVKRHSSASGTVYALRRYRSAEGAPWQGSSEPAPQTPPLTDAQVSVPMLLTMALVQLPLMLLLPVVLGFVLRRRLGSGWKVFFLGAATFVASQVVHLPLNWSLGLLGGGGVARLPLPLVGLIAGLSAGLCEELARYGTMHWFLKKERGWHHAVQLGAGHGGSEAIILAGLVLLGAISMVLTPYYAALVPAEQQPAVALAAHAYWQTPWYLSALAGWERVLAITFHISASVLVMRAVVRRRPGYLLAAILLHTALDAPVVYLKQVGLFWMYTFLTVFAAGCLLLIIKLREPPPEPAEPQDGKPAEPQDDEPTAAGSAEGSA